MSPLLSPLVLASCLLGTVRPCTLVSQVAETKGDMVEPRLLHSFDETRASLGGVSRTKVYDLVRDGDLVLVKIGRRSFITDQSLRCYVQGLAAGSAAS